ncbi:WXG100-like domain-containing protein [Tenggerimyces flavus]|uniref:Outer membrane channel protein CpnT-like N-terminal domain-containing protein n=1 Tax=Tenggerimyces flavus TaxID=1708749 RepID=A0ABV7Y925_9ACTN|nr:hypothetical protein [Tenggerimyces flavus]MBM7783623.1 K+-sensing histidine kinase KdpD [Tenggerimyces flavus]
MAQGITLPGPLITLLSDLGYLWPDADEVRLLELGQAWADVYSKLDGVVEQAQQAAQKVWTENEDDAIDAFKTSWEAKDDGVQTLTDNATGVMLVGAIILVCAIVVLMLKIWVIVQLVLLAIAIAQAIATAIPTFGASLLEIPVFKEIFGRIINLLISRSLTVLLG